MNGPYIVLNDRSTYSSADGCMFVLLNDEAQQDLEETNDFENVRVSGATIVSIDDLVDAYNQVNGTDY